MTLLLAFLPWIPKIALGFGLLRLLWPGKQAPDWLFALFAGIPLGLGVSSSLFMAWLALGLLRLPYLFVEFALAVGLLFLAFRRGLPPPVRFSRLEWGAVAFTLLLVAVSMGVFFNLSLRLPHGYEDAWFIWNMAARFLFRAQVWTLRFDAQSALWHPDYPLLLPLNVMQGWVLAGETTRVPILLAAIFTLSGPGVLFAALWRLRGPLAASLGAGLLLLTPWYTLYGTHQQADIPLAIYILASAAALALYQREKAPGLLALAGGLAAYAAWTKNEGWPWWLILSLGALVLNNHVVASARSLRARQPAESQPLPLNGGLFRTFSPRGDMGIYFLGSLPPIVTALAFKFFLAPGTDLFVENVKRLAQLTDPARYGQIISAYAAHIANFGGLYIIGILWPLLALALLLGFRKDAPLWPWLALAALQIIYFFIYVITPHDLDWHLRTSLDRLLMQTHPLALLALCAALNLPLEAEHAPDY